MADYVKKRTHIINHERFLRAGPVARDLYDWGMLWSGQQETDGELPMVAVLASPWGAGGKANVRVATKLVDIGLWERTDEGFRILKWTEQGNVTKSQLEEKRQAARERMRSKRNAASGSQDVRANIERTSPEVPTYTSPSTSLSSESTSVGRKGEPRGSRVLRPDEPLSDQRRKDFEAITFNLPARDIEPEWRAFVDHRISVSRLFASAEAIDADWRRWVHNQNVLEAKARIKAQNDHAPSPGRKGSGGGPRGDRQPHDQGWIDRMQQTGTGGEF